MPPDVPYRPEINRPAGWRLRADKRQPLPDAFLQRCRVARSRAFVFQFLLFTVYFEQRRFHLPGGDAVGNGADDGFDLPRGWWQAAFRLHDAF